MTRSGKDKGPDVGVEGEALAGPGGSAEADLTTVQRGLASLQAAAAAQTGALEKLTSFLQSQFAPADAPPALPPPVEAEVVAAEPPPAVEELSSAGAGTSAAPPVEMAVVRSAPAGPYPPGILFAGGRAGFDGNFPRANDARQVAILLQRALKRLSPECEHAGAQLAADGGYRMSVAHAQRLDARLDYVERSGRTARLTLKDRMALTYYAQLTNDRLGQLSRSVAGHLILIQSSPSSPADKHRARATAVQRAAVAVDAAVHEEGLLALLSDSCEIMVTDIYLELQLLSGASAAGGEITKAAHAGAETMRAARADTGLQVNPQLAKATRDMAKTLTPHQSR